MGTVSIGFGTCIVLIRTDEEIYIAADTLRNQKDRSEEGAISESQEHICKVIERANVVFASSGLNYLIETNFYVQEIFKALVDPQKTISKNLDLLEPIIKQKHLDALTYIGAHPEYDYNLIKDNPVHIAIVGLENDKPFMAVIKIFAEGPPNAPTNRIERQNNPGKAFGPVKYYEMGCPDLVEVADGRGCLPNIQDGISEWLDTLMRWAIKNQEEPPTIGGDITLLRVSNAGVEWINRPEACKE